jgi:predicted Rossmann fold flavoprotein
MIYDICIIGAGASSLMCASHIKNKSICILETNKTIANKIKISGGAKCNITNKYMSEDYFLGDKEFVKNTLSNFSNTNLQIFLNKNNLQHNLNPKIVKGTYFCKTSQDVIDMFKKLTKHCTIKLNTKVIDVIYDNTFVTTTNQGNIKSKKLIVASGGMSYESIGASDIGYKIAKNFGHSVTKLNPALVGFTVQKDQFWFKELSGLSMNVEIKVLDKVIKGAMLFTHKGCSGPAILTTSLYWEKGKITIDFLPNKDEYLQKRFKKIVKELNIDIHNYEFSPAGNFGYTKAEVTKGGVNTNEIDFNMQSLKQKNLYFIGEVLDVTGELGGYNFQWAFSSAVTCARAIQCV